MLALAGDLSRDSHCSKRCRESVENDLPPFRAVQRYELLSIGCPDKCFGLMETCLATLTVRGGGERGKVDDRSRLAQWHTVADPIPSL